MRWIFATVVALTFWLGQPVDAQERQSEVIGVFESDPGDICVVSEVNNESVWPGNTLVITSGDESVTLEGVEDNPDSSFGASIVSDGVVVATVYFDVFTSLEVTAVCSPPPPETTTTTEEETTTTTEEETTTTVTVVDCIESPGVAGCPETTTTSEPDEPTTTSTVPDDPTTTTSEPVEECGPDELACTGVESAAVAAAAGLLLGGGAALIVLRRVTLR